MTKEQILKMIASRVEGQGNQVDTGTALPIILRGIVELAGMKRVELLYDERTGQITELGKTDPLNYEQVVGLVNDTEKFVTMFTIQGEYLLPQLNDGGAVIFTGLNVLSYGSWAHRVAINVDNEIKADMYELEQADRIGDLADLHTDHKDKIVNAINEVADALESEELVVSMLQSTAERKAIYDLCAAHLQLAKNIVFYQPVNQMYYRVNGYNMVNGALKLHVFVGTDSVVATIAANGTISVEQ